MTGHRLSDQEFLGLLAAREPAWDVDREGGFLLVPLDERHGAEVLASCQEDAEGDYYVLGAGDAVLFARERDHNFACYLTL